MTPEALERGEGAQGLGGPLEQSPGWQVAEVVRGQVGEQGQADVGRRSAMRDDAHGLFLDVIGRQPVVVGPDELVEEGPGPASEHAQEPALFAVEARCRRDERSTQPPRECRCA